MVREIEESELAGLLDLYLHLHETCVPEMTEHVKATWQAVMNDPNHHIIVKLDEGRIVSSCVCVVIPNLTRNARPYALIENVVTHSGYRCRGYATECLAYAEKIAAQANCYKMMLLTGAKEASTLAFYKKAGYRDADKTAFVRWLGP